VLCATALGGTLELLAVEPLHGRRRREWILIRDSAIALGGSETQVTLTLDETGSFWVCKSGAHTYSVLRILHPPL